MSGPFADFSDGDDDHHSRACQCGQSVGWWCVEGRSVLARQQQYIKRAHAAHTMSMTMCTVPNVSDFTPHARTLAKSTQTQRMTRASPTVTCGVDSLVPYPYPFHGHARANGVCEHHQAAALQAPHAPRTSGTAAARGRECARRVCELLRGRSTPPELSVPSTPRPPP